MNAPTRLAGFAAILALASGGAALAGAAIDPDRETPEPAHAGEAPDAAAAGHSEPSGGAHESSGAPKQRPVRGLAVAENGLRVVVDDPELRHGARERLAFRIVNDRGDTLRDFDVEHEKRMHLIIVRRDLTGFQHLHPKQAEDGTWTVDVTIEDPGSYRLFADFARRGENHTLASDLRIDGDADLRPLPKSAASPESDGGYDVRLDAGRARPGQEADLRFTITKAGETVHTEPYLGAGGHLVALREGDLAFLHVHPTDGEHAAEGGADEHDDSVGFAATFPTQGGYRLFLQFKHEGRVQTVAFTQEVR